MKTLTYGIIDYSTECKIDGGYTFQYFGTHNTAQDAYKALRAQMRKNPNWRTQGLGNLGIEPGVQGETFFVPTASTEREAMRQALRDAYPVWLSAVQEAVERAEIQEIIRQG